jgi:mRNA-degrading endonuclease toxin of MazEF toxin-antitoxin module
VVTAPEQVSEREPRRGDIYWIDLPDAGGHVIRGRRPVLVIQTDRLHRSSTVIVLPMTTSAKAAAFHPPFLVEARARDTGLRKSGWIKCDQPFTVPTVALGQRSGRLDPSVLGRVDAAIRFVLAI